MTQDVIIRAFTPDDAEEMSALFKASVLKLGTRFYTCDQVTAWAERGPSPQKIVTRNKEGLRTLVAQNTEGEILAYAELEADGHIDQVYARPDAAGKGVVSNLYDELETTARKLNLSKLYTEASEGARRFFRKKNFIEIGRRDFEIDGVVIHNFAMEKEL